MSLRQSLIMLVICKQEGKDGLYRSPDYQTGFESVGLRFKRRRSIQTLRLRPLGSSWISNRNIFSYFDLQVISIFPMKFRVNWPFG